jgi:hypothetical protein
VAEVQCRKGQDGCHTCNPEQTACELCSNRCDERYVLSSGRGGRRGSWWNRF